MTLRNGESKRARRGVGGGRAERRSSDDTRTDDIRRGPAKFISRREYDRATRIAATGASASTGTRRDARTNIILSTRGESEEKRVVREDRGREEWAGSVDAPCSPSGPNSTLPVRENTSRLPYPRGYELYRRNSNNPEFPRVVIRCSPPLLVQQIPPPNLDEKKNGSIISIHPSPCVCNEKKEKDSR